MALKVLRFHAENFKRLVVVDISPDGNVITISGKNAQGKTSVLDALWAALAGGEAKADKPIRDGEKTAVVRLDLGDVIVTRKWTKDDVGTLTVESPAGGKFSSPQRMLDDLIGRRAFDPLEFVRQSAKDQVATLISTVDLPFNPADLEAKRRMLFDERTEFGRDVDRLTAQLEAFDDPDDRLPAEELSIMVLFAELQEADASNEAITEAVDDLAYRQTAVKDARERVVEAQDRLAEAEEALARQQRAVDALPDRIDIAPIRDRIDGAEELNTRIRAQRARASVAAQLADAQAKREEHTKRLDAIAEGKRLALAKVRFPVDGLSFDEAGVTFNGIPFSQASAAEQLRVSVGLAMAANPKLRVLRILDGSLLDTESMQIIGELAAENDYQVWVEVVDESGTLGVVIEDGRVASLGEETN